MSIPIATGANSASSLSSVSSSAAGKEEKVQPKDASATEMSVNDRTRLQLNASIMQASLNVSIGSENEPLALLYKTAITNINEALKGQYGDDAIQNAASQDNSAEATAQRIVSLSTGFFDAFKKQNPDLDDDAALSKFMDTISGGMEKGFKEARDILGGLKVLGGDIAGNIDKTYELVQKGYADFIAAHSSKKDDAAAPTTPAKPADSKAA
ncbi:MULTISPECIES: DUF5610 domain-containing protein [unclassified Janthinobacterium]|uniref:DUF5610 domain-containing protein n=1 Tax=unclassified Janthinobacterium TaxID=2610881 RepID=UPI00088EDBA0|nr:MULTISPECIES: DUF5610 domain-containing protein [unclassified Janthinobacterium]SDA63805.1 hypothetical protein SAMN03159349_02779 [Janthinobacterium sp. 551a]SFB17484.1 hypothetical protein SAMN03159300_102444 [Janthinobacterium sp. 344]